MKQTAMDIEYGLTKGASASGTSAVARAMNGLAYWCSASGQTVTAASATFGTSTGEAALNFALAAQFQASPIDEPNFLLISPYNKILLNRWTSTNTRWVSAGDKKLVATIGIYESSFGVIEVYISNILANTNGTQDLAVYGGNMDTLSIAWLRKPFSEPLAKTGDFTAFQVVAEGTLQVSNPYALFNIDLNH